MRRSMLVLMLLFILPGAIYSAAEENSASYYYDEFFRCGLHIPGEWGAVNIDKFRPTIVPTGISPELFDVLWYQEVRLVPGIRVLWVWRLPGNNYGSVYLRFAPICYVLEEGQSMNAMGMNDIQQALEEWGKAEGAEISTEPANIAGVPGLRFFVQGPGYGFAISYDGTVATSSVIYACTVFAGGHEYLFTIEMCCPTDDLPVVLPGFEEAVAGFAFGDPLRETKLIKFDDSISIPLVQGPPGQFNFSAPPASMIDEAPFNPYEGSLLVLKWEDGKEIPFPDLKSRGDMIETVRLLVEDDEEISDITVWLQYPSNELSEILEEVFSDLAFYGVEIKPVFQQGTVSFDGATTKYEGCDWIESIEIPLDFDVISANLNITSGSSNITAPVEGEVLLGNGANFEVGERYEADPFSNSVLQLTWEDERVLRFDISTKNELLETAERVLDESDVIQNLTIWFQFPIDETLVKPLRLWSGFLHDEIIIEPVFLIGYLEFNSTLTEDEVLNWLRTAEIPAGLSLLSTLLAVTPVESSEEEPVYKVPEVVDSEITQTGVFF